MNKRSPAWCCFEARAFLAHAGPWLMLAALMAVAALAAGGSELGAPDDLEVKAGFVLNFLRLVNWTKVPGESDSRELPVCAGTTSEFFTAFRKISAGKSAGGRAIVTRIEPVPDVSRCRVLLVDRPSYRGTRQTLSVLKDAPILTVGNGSGFVDQGGMFELVVEQGRVQFYAGLEAIRRSGLDVSARLLALAQNVKTGGMNGN